MDYKKIISFLVGKIKRRKKESENLIFKKKVIGAEFVKAVGYIPDFENPKSFNEKLQWLKLYYRDPLLTKCADKFLVREYIKEKIGEKYLVSLFGVYKKVKDIDFDKLPNKFVLKVNHGSGQNIVCKDKGNLDLRDTREKLEKWMKPESNHYNYSFEWCYKNIEPRIICEQFIETEDGDLKDYKFMCFNGKVKMVFVCSERKNKLKVDFFDLNWKKLPFIRKYENSSKNLEKPINFEKMITLANKLSEPFPFVRVDLYNINGRILTGELTFYPGNGVEPFLPVYWDYKIGNLLKLESLDSLYLK